MSESIRQKMLRVARDFAKRTFADIQILDEKTGETTIFTKEENEKFAMEDVFSIYPDFDKNEFRNMVIKLKERRN